MHFRLYLQVLLLFHTLSILCFHLYLVLFNISQNIIYFAILFVKNLKINSNIVLLKCKKNWSKLENKAS